MKASQRNRNKADLRSFFIAALTVYYRKDAEAENATAVIKERTLNVIADTTGPVTKDDLHNMQQEAFRRLYAENNVQQEDLVDVVVQNISFLGDMTREHFLGSDAEKQQLAEAAAAGSA